MYDLAWPVTLLMVEGNVCTSSLHTHARPAEGCTAPGGRARSGEQVDDGGDLRGATFFLSFLTLFFFLTQVQPGETWWAASDLGWIVGHEYTCYSPLLARCVQIDVCVPDWKYGDKRHTLLVVPLCQEHVCGLRGEAGGHPGLRPVLPCDRGAQGGHPPQTRTLKSTQITSR